MSRPDIKKEEIDAVLSTLNSGWLSQGKITQEFDASLSEYLSSNVATVNNGSSALMCALIAHGIKPGDKIVVPAFTFIATSSVPKILGAEIILADIDPHTLNVNPETVEEIVKRINVKMVILVDVAGLPTDIDAFIELSKRYNFILLEDAAEALGSEYKNKKLGSFEHTTIFSFHIAKLITTVEGGCISTGDDNIFKRIMQIKDYGRSINERYVHDIIGSNFRITDLQSAIGLQQLKKIEDHISRRIEIATQYRKQIKNLEFQRIPNYATKHSYMLFFAFAENMDIRDRYLRKLNERGIDARKSWMPINMQPCNPELQNTGFINAENVFNKALTLPIYNSMTSDEVKTVIDECQKL